MCVCVACVMQGCEQRTNHLQKCGSLKTIFTFIEENVSGMDMQLYIGNYFQIGLK